MKQEGFHILFQWKCYCSCTFSCALVVQSVRLMRFQWQNNQFESEERRPHSLAHTFTFTSLFWSKGCSCDISLYIDHESSRASHIKLIFKQIAVRFVVTNKIISIVIIIKSMINSLHWTALFHFHSLLLVDAAVWLHIHNKVTFSGLFVSLTSFLSVLYNQTPYTITLLISFGQINVECSIASLFSCWLI